MSDTRNASLDLLRGLAALAVCAGHLRAFLFKDWIELEQRTILDAGFYLLTGFSHPSVMAFFVLSGYLVGGSTYRLWRQDLWTWQDFLVRRLVRLQIVLVPALIMTAGFDLIGIHLTHGIGYDGSFYKLLAMMPSAVSVDLDTLTGNILFLQTITHPTFGTNGPLWSLANEFWYYLMFPLMLGACKGGRLYRFACIAAVGAACFLLPLSILMFGIIWLYGVAIAIIEKMHRASDIYCHPAYFWGALSWLGVALVSYKLWIVWLGNDWMVGAAFAAFTLALTKDRIESKVLRSISLRMADMSYTLYLFHFPLMAFLWFCWIAPLQFAPSFHGYAAYFTIMLASLGYSYAMWWVFERHTDTVRRFVAGLLNGRRL